MLAGGPDIAYPRSHVELYGRIVASGAAVSEHPPGTAAARYQFAARNRIMAALGEVVVIVEAALPSGSMITADLAAGMGRTVGARSGPGRRPGRRGPQRSAQRGRARDPRRPATCSTCCSVSVPSRRLRATARSPAIARGRRWTPASRPRSRRSRAGARTVDRVAAEAALAPRDAAVALARLERLGLRRRPALGRVRALGAAAPAAARSLDSRRWPADPESAPASRSPARTRAAGRASRRT